MERDYYHVVFLLRGFISGSPGSSGVTYDLEISLLIYTSSSGSCLGRSGSVGYRDEGN